LPRERLIPLPLTWMGGRLATAPFFVAAHGAQIFRLGKKLSVATLFGREKYLDWL